MVFVFILVVVLAWVLQVLFSVLYHKKIPSWRNNPYGRLAQLGSLSHVTLLSLYIYFVFFGHLLPQRLNQLLFILGFIPLIFFGFMQLRLLNKAVEESRKETEDMEESSDN